jgi:hypothetical protein
MKNTFYSVGRVEYKAVTKNLSKPLLRKLGKLNAIANGMLLLVLLSSETMLKVLMLLESSFHGKNLAWEDTNDLK